MSDAAPAAYEERLRRGREAPSCRRAPARASVLQPRRRHQPRGRPRPACLFTRVSPFGIEGIAQRLAERRGLTLEHARQWLTHVGLEQPVEEIEGDPETVAAARDALAEGAAKLADELRLSLDYYARPGGRRARRGRRRLRPGQRDPRASPSASQRELGLRFESAAPPPLAHLDDAAAARLTLSYGLALEE